MKNLRKYLIIIGIILFGGLSITIADEIPEFTHYIKRCVKIEKPDIATGYKIIAGISSVMGNELYEIQENTCLKQHYHAGCTNLFLVQKNLNINNIKFGGITKGCSFFEDFGHGLTLSEEGILVPMETLETNDDTLKQYFGNDYFSLGELSVIGGYVSNDIKKTYENITYKLIQENGEYKLIISNIESDEMLPNNNETGINHEVNLHRSIQTKIDKSYIHEFLQSRITTILLETFVLFFLCKLFFKKDNIKTRKIILTGIIASSITLPILRFVLPYIFHNYTVYAIFGEIFVTFVEVFIIKYLLDINRQKATIASIACNLFSVIIGLLL